MLELGKLPYDINVLGDFLSAETFSYHHGKHHQTYASNLNNLIQNTKFAGKDLVSIIKSSSGGVFNNATQVCNHDFYLDCITPSQSTCERPDLGVVLEKNFGSLESFKNESIRSATGAFGSDWFWFVLDSETQKLESVGISNAATPIYDNKIPLLVVDVWEHTYYIDHKNTRPVYLKGFHTHIN